ncbi:MAG TPA: pseudouridine synthase, partial [Polyangia bacterium]
MTRAGRSESPAATASAAGGRFEVTSEAAGQRLDALVSQTFGLSRAAARRLVAAGRVRLDGRIARKGATVAAGAVVTVAGPLSRDVDPVPDHDDAARSEGDGAIALVYEDADLLAVNKPAGMPSHPLRAGERGTAANFLVAHDPACAKASLDPREGGLGHRLDTATSGVLVAARSRPAWLALRAALAAPECEKRYRAEVWGAPPPSRARRSHSPRRANGSASGLVGTGGSLSLMAPFIPQKVALRRTP